MLTYVEILTTMSWWRKEQMLPSGKLNCLVDYSTLSHNVVSSTPHHERDPNSQL
jgi:hypothetical protein